MVDTWTATREDGSTLELGDGTPYWVTRFAPHKAPNINSADQTTAYGSVGGQDSDGARDMTLSVLFGDDDPTALLAALEELATVFKTGSQEIQLDYVIGGAPSRTRWVRSRGIEDLTDPEVYYGQDGVDLKLTALNPRSYGAETPVTVNATPQATDHGGEYETAAWTLTVTGPCAGASFVGTNSSGDAFTLVLPAVLDGHRLEVDARHGEAWDVLISTSAYSQAVVQDDGGRPAVFWPLHAGTADVSFTSSSGATTAALKVRAAHL